MKATIKIIVLICIFNYTNLVSAQQGVDTYNRNFKLGVGVNTGLPLSDPYSFNLGGDVRLQYNISTTYSLCFTAGYNNLFVKKNGTDFNYVPVKVGYKSFIFSNNFYVMGELGGAFSTTKEYSYNSLLFAPSIGLGTKYIDVSVRYEFLKDFPIVKDNVADNGLGQLMLRLAYGFSL
ncbi:hypothetical protein [Mariniflexile sp. AS56]|uniref:hypothetical protein n=1 Tax=Mariniflexile sp. AS56 TaxID=3063957 RepID=UPI0026EE041B|nr:hypothetical protein [Mariniflexile sp. AS56]MDO7172345.1 hypothetical protein [Mariniflexile sp. AS56]